FQEILNCRTFLLQCETKLIERNRRLPEKLNAPLLFCYLKHNESAEKKWKGNGGRVAEAN
ncbi:MAG: hypothetical protein ABSG87_10265, partial [Verrucomicrobiota bacterium]